MSFIPAANVAKVSMVGHRTDTASQWVNVFHFKFPGAIAEADRLQLLTDMDAWWTNHYAPVLSAQCYIDNITATDLTSSSAGSSTFTYAPPDHGALSNNVKPGNVSGVVTHRTALRGRNYRGRTYIPGVVDEQTTNHDYFDTTSLGNLLAAFAWLMAGTHTHSAIWSVLSLFLNNLPRGAGVATPINAVTMDNTFDSMRRRLPGRGS